MHTKDIIDKIVLSEYHDPFQALGVHFFEPNMAVIRTFQPHAVGVDVLIGTKTYAMTRVSNEGIFEFEIKRSKCPDPDFHPFNYRFHITYLDGNTYITNDCYRFLPQLGEEDRYLFNSGTNYALYDHMGAHPATYENISGTIFRVWAPAAKRVSVLGKFNGWDGRVHQMRSLESTGIWEIFIPGVAQDELYKYEIKTQQDEIKVKSDPFQFFGEFRPNTASIVRDLNAYSWGDTAWQQKQRTNPPYDRPLSIYEIHPGSWKRDPENPDRFLTFKELAGEIIPYAKKLGFTHIELMPVMEHPLDESWGYQVTAPFSLTSRYGIPEDFMYFVDQCHQNDIGVILDWVPAHFPKDDYSLGRFDGTALYEHEDPKKGYHPEWGTLIYNYGRKEVSNFLIANALFYLDKYHVDGLRVDAVASMLYLDYSRKDGEWIPNCYGGHENLEAIEFIRHMNAVVYQYFPNTLMVAEESTSFYGVSKPADSGGLGFGFKWNMGWMNDILSYFTKDPLFRKYHHNVLTFSIVYAFTENFILPLSHDEVVHGKGSLINKMPGDLWQKFANLRLLFMTMWMHPGKKLLFMGGEFGQWSEWYCKTSLDWHLLEQNDFHAKLLLFVSELNHFYRENPSLWEQDFSYEGFQWIDLEDRNNSIISFARFAKDRKDHLVCLLNFTPQPLSSYKLGLPTGSRYREIFCSDDSRYGGTDKSDKIIYTAIAEPHAQAEFHTTLTVPPLAGVILQPCG